MSTTPQLSINVSYPDGLSNTALYSIFNYPPNLPSVLSFAPQIHLMNNDENPLAPFELTLVLTDPGFEFIVDGTGHVETIFVDLDTGDTTGSEPENLGFTAQIGAENNIAIITFTPLVNKWIGRGFGLGVRDTISQQTGVADPTIINRGSRPGTTPGAEC